MKTQPARRIDTVRDTWALACPKCGSDQHLEIELVCWAPLSADGTDPEGDHHWDQNSACRCDACHAHGTVKGFTLPGQ